MSKKFSFIYFVLMACLVLSLSGCGSSSSSFSGDTTTPKDSQVVTIDTPALTVGNSYKIIKGASLSGMDNAKFFVKNIGSKNTQAAVNLGFSDYLGNNTLIIVDENDTNNVVFAYDPFGTNTTKTSGTVKYSGGKTMRYRGLNLASSMFSAMNIDTETAKVIRLNGDSATINGTAVNVYDYVWHSDPNHRDEYYTEGLNSTTELSSYDVSDSVYIAHDVRYMTNDLEFTALVTNDNEQEYAAYYSDTVRQIVSDELGGTLTGPYIFATLPKSQGMPNNPGGGNPPDFPGNFTRDRANYNDEIASTMSLMTHSASEAYNNPVLHITEPGVYSLTGTWNGQIWIEVGEESTDKVAIILDSVDVTCTVAPALVFKKVYECGPNKAENVASELGNCTGTEYETFAGKIVEDAGAMILIADDTTNNFTGSNVYRMLKPQVKKSSVTTINGTDVSQQKKRYKMDGALYSFMSMVVGGSDKANGVLNIKSSSYEGLDTEMHMVLESGVVTVYALDDGMNFNEDDTSVFVMVDGDLSVTSTGGDGIDSNGYIGLLNGKLDITVAQDSNEDNAQAEGPIDADINVYRSENVVYTHQSYSGGTDIPSQPGSGDIPSQPGSGDIPSQPGSGDIPSQPGSGDIPSQPGSGDIPSQPGSDDIQVNPPSTEDDNKTDEPDIVDDDNKNNNNNNNDDNNNSSTDDNKNNNQEEPDIVDDNKNNNNTNTETDDNNNSSDDDSKTDDDNNNSSTDDNNKTDEPDIIDDNNNNNNTNTDDNNNNNNNNNNQQDNDVDYVPTVLNWETDTIEFSTSRGITNINMGLGSTSAVIKDTDNSPRNIDSSSNSFKLTHKVNDFSQITE